MILISAYFIYKQINSKTIANYDKVPSTYMSKKEALKRFTECLESKPEDMFVQEQKDGLYLIGFGRSTNHIGTMNLETGECEHHLSKRGS